ncbi:class I adenylate-forming enzyme family protein [Streptomyces sp. NBC_01257]|uniref:class I adenylate-forming enzyme family protein n=1 Tax=Streptomyces sp. NBC_01257 TaxID=2903799 RepID=UPI002DDAE802|nr:class I adenylate-forming enzyme family protein [Streptomyces sp. NBC_01257]WRZ69182.1 acyl--CoA ligase [Streptomyces sp. NBC_01257]
MNPRRPKGMPDTLDYPPGVCVGDILAGAARRHPDRTALLDGSAALTYAELYDRALRCAQGLRERGIRPGDVVALHQPNSLWFSVTYYGILLAGATAAPMNPTLPPATLREQLDEVSAVAAITHPATAEALLAAGTERLRPVVVVTGTDIAPAPDGSASPGTVPLDDLLAAEPVEGPRADPESIAHLSFTGGTTGRSKAVMVLHRHVVHNVLQFTCWRTGALPAVDEHGGIRTELVPGAQTAAMAPSGDGVSVGISPLFHAMGLISQSNAVLAGQTVLLAGRFHPHRYLKLVEDHGATHVTGSPALLHALIAAADGRSFPGVRTVNSGAAPIDTTTLEALRALFPNAAVVEGYGLTEATMGLVTGLVDLDDQVPVGSAGLPVFDTEIEIRDPAGPGKALPAGETGELWARGPQITAGYLGHPELTAEQYADGWLRTGDIARQDEHGHVFVVDRLKDMLIYKGYNVYPGALEELLTRHPAVDQACVIGAPSASAGEIPVAYVVVRPPAASGPVLAEELMDHVAARVAPYQKVREIHFVDSLPTSAAGKILKTELRRRHRSAGLH